jgi:hypothetical protein
MKTQPLSVATRERLDATFLAAERVAAERLLVEQCGNNLPFLEKLDAVELERFRFAALKISDGAIAGLEKAVNLANTDWRDLLMSAGFGEDVKAHQGWRPTGGAG